LNSRPLSFATIGSAVSFASQAAVAVRAACPYLSAPEPYSDAKAMFAAVRAGEVDAAIGSIATRVGGFTPMVDAVLGSDPPLYVIHEQQIPFRACLLAHPGARLEDVKTVHGGHASLPLAEDFVRTEMRWARCVPQDSGAATADRIRGGDLSIAMLGTRRMAEQGFGVLAKDLDGEASGLWWVVSHGPLFDPQPKLLVVALRSADDGGLGRFAADAAAAGWLLSSIAARPTGAGLLAADMLLRLRGEGPLADAEGLAERHGASLLGALAGQSGKAA
jgi:prephenate dehydratase